MESLWFRRHGPPKELVSDIEGGIWSWQTAKLVTSHSIELKPRPPGSHANYVERRGALLKDTLNKIATDIQAQKDPILDVDRDIEHVVAEAVYAGNAMLSINGYSPYSAVYGRVPQILPGINQIDLPLSTEPHNRPADPCWWRRRRCAELSRPRETSRPHRVHESPRPRLLRACCTASRECRSAMRNFWPLPVAASPAASSFA